MRPLDAMTPRPMPLASAVLLACLIALTVYVLPRTLREFSTDAVGLQGGPTATPAAPPAGVALVVNGIYVFTTTIQLGQAHILEHESAGDEPITDEQACLTAVDRAVRTELLHQLAVASGVTASETAAAQGVETLQASATEEPLIADYLDAQQDRLGLTDQEHVDLLRSLTREQLADTMAHETVAAGAPTPSGTEIAAYLADNPPNHIVLMALSFADGASATAAYLELFDTLSEIVEPGAFAAEFIAYGKQAGIYDESAIKVSESYSYADPSELPDYVQAAAEGAEGSLGELSRSDGSGVVYYVLASERHDSDTYADHVEQSVLGQMRFDYLGAEYEAMVQAAEVEVLIDCSDFP